jgi:peptide/nickel transport system substrate-binding protein
MTPIVRGAMAAAGVALGLAAAIVPALAQKQGGTLRVYQRENPPSASIHEEATISTAFPFMGLFNNLVMFDPQKQVESLETIVPDLAESWSLDASHNKLTFKLRQGVVWHDDKPFTAKDVVCTWDLINGTTEGARKSPRKIWYDNVEKITADSDHQVTFHLKQPQPSLPILLASGLTPIYPCHVNAQGMRTKPIGTGPFRFVHYNRNESIRIERNPKYWNKGFPYLDAIDFRIIPSRSTRILAFIAGEFDLTFVDDVTIPLLKDVAGEPEYTAVRQGRDQERDVVDPRPQGVQRHPRRGQARHRRGHDAASRWPLGHAAGGAVGVAGLCGRRGKEPRRGPEDHGRPRLLEG